MIRDAAGQEVARNKSRRNIVSLIGISGGPTVSVGARIGKYEEQPAGTEQSIGNRERAKDVKHHAEFFRDSLFECVLG